jgi:hypothetical protein
MLTALIRTIQDIQTRKKSGLLMTTACAGEASKDLPEAAITGHFSFFFKEGVLATVLCRGMGMGPAISRVASITSVIKTQWTATNASTITISDDQVSTDRLLELLGAQKLDLLVEDLHKDQLKATAASALETRSQKIFLQVLGSAGEAALDAVRTRCDPKMNPEGFKVACVAELTPIVGLKTAQALLQG